MLTGPAWQTSLVEGRQTIGAKKPKVVTAVSPGQLLASETPVTQRPLEANHVVSSIFPYLGGRI